MKKTVALAALCIALLASCGGGNGDGDGDPAQPQLPAEPEVAQPAPKARLYVVNDVREAGFDAYVDRYHQLTLEDGVSWIVDDIDASGHPRFFAQGVFTLAYEASGIAPVAPWPWTNVERSDRYRVFKDAAALVATGSSVLKSALVEVVETPGSADLLASTVFHSAAYTFDYGKAASVSDIAGAWVFYNPGRKVPKATLTVASTGAFSGVNEATGCNYAGTLAPRASGKNVFDAAVTLTGCVDAGSYAGVAYSSRHRPMNIYEPGYFVTLLKLMALKADRTQVFNLQMTPAPKG
jgi:hypothetical protein